MSIVQKIMELLQQNSTFVLKAAIGFAILILVFQISNTTSSGATSAQVIEVATQSGKVKIDLDQLTKEVLPAKQILPVTWNGIPYTLVDKKIIDLEKIKAYSSRYDQSVTDNDLKIFEKDYNGNIEITPHNSVLIYNVLWAIGFAAKSPILNYELEKYGWDTVKNLAGYYFSFANLGNGSTLPQAGYNYFDLIPLSQEARGMVMKIVGKSAVPSCGNPLNLPDCSCAYAIDALILMMSSQGFNESQIYQAMKVMYPYRYPGIYVQQAIFFQLTENKSWSEVNPEELVSVQFSSAQGVFRVRQALANILGSTPVHSDNH